MECRDVRLYLSEYLDGELDKPRPEGQAPPEGLASPSSLRRDIDAHLESCADCRRELELLRKTVEAVRALPTRSLPADIRLQIDRGIEREMLAAAAEPAAGIPEGRPPAPSRHSTWAYALPVAASVLIVVGLALHFYLSFRPRSGEMIARGSEEASTEEAAQPALLDDLAELKGEATSEGYAPSGGVAVGGEIDFDGSKGVESLLRSAEVDQLGFTARQSVEAVRREGLEKQVAEKEELPRAAEDVRFLLAESAQPALAVTFNNAVIVPATANEELEAILTANNWTNNLSRAGNVYNIEIPADEVSRLADKLAQAKSFKPVKAGEYGYATVFQGRFKDDVHSAMPPTSDHVMGHTLRYADTDSDGATDTEMESVMSGAYAVQASERSAVTKALPDLRVPQKESADELGRNALSSLGKDRAGGTRGEMRMVTDSAAAQLAAYRGFVLVNIVLGTPRPQVQPLDPQRQQAPQPAATQMQQQSR